MKISVIIPVLNEARLIQKTLAHVIYAGRSADREIIVVDGGSQDGTREVAGKLADKVLQARRGGRAHQMHEGAQAARGEVLLFLHADTRLPEAWDVALWHAWSVPIRPAATAFRLSYDNPRLFFRVLAGLANWRSRVSGVPHGDQAIAVARDSYFAVGGFPSVPLMEEYYLLPKLRRRGQVVILPERIQTSARRYEENGPLFNAIRNTALVGLHYMGISPERLAAFYNAPRQRSSHATEEQA